jgi:ABC-type polysaccharide/polyol phosphate export permease
VSLAVTWYFTGFQNLPVLYTVLPGMAVLLLLGLFLAIVCGTVQVHFPDAGHLLEIVLQFLFYLTPIIYQPENLRGRDKLTWLIHLNPCSYILDLIRQPVVYGRYPPLESLAVTLACVGVLGVLACICLRRFERTLVFWV